MIFIEINRASFSQQDTAVTIRLIFCILLVTKYFEKSLLTFISFENLEIVSSLVKIRNNLIVVYLRGNIYIFGGSDNKLRGFVNEVEMYSHLTKKCKVVANIDDISNNKLCGFSMWF